MGKNDNKVVNFVFTREDILKQLETFKAAKGKTVIPIDERYYK